ncbi:UDP-N-acetylmuramoylalanine--D-glutamate ligase OS=Tsukamurella paurometabola (strain ATCC 8368 /DSM / CCUG 35730 / CIP 100753 / JCM 10117 / KCTC 9821/ NBRC 16120 / NCIMB 702349 / NCTC 13040) OX=521096 GN=murD PE=3 SV=1 [Tsukamurella paurometabola]|uniref:UDP-N-acetylmuramoylalanine--D-glutamate ligase n=1 Tax=Tsukamurella paurometabola (strain ATCC 8368 / DSM 20162 / CCUG 35730 / CIP 100753 / JCM 10117 / KCTC 9821 / NBRC 16120 / NCIMB 702349 / NCTC 13040) TaxID=521096 RepID=D5USH7_TSUPD|nr:UDP-N-acetylmuramoyl-L-alanine--D-glutamate ligase [Tsukamurella paurometabola]ADG79248.1 UDP-N-acetylmuramoylalanine/D-glutamate ligase [Tsukamurella paurometabola DSM 20162]SUP34753.1 UDP-N-acetylmuramoylalanine--D-glutamate ligase [Tsukamurella paurometabola]
MTTLPGPGAHVLVAGGGVTGPAVARALLRLGAAVTVADGKPVAREKIAAEVPEVAVVDLDDLDPAGYALVVVAPGFRPTAPIVVAAQDAGVPVIGDVELAWWIDRAGAFGAPRDWLVVTGTNGKTTTTQMLESILAHAGLPAVACGNIGRPVIDAIADAADPRVLAVELSSFQLHWAPSVRPRAGVVLNIAEDHLDWHGSMAAYTADKARALTGDIAVVGLDDPVAATLPAATGFTVGEPAPGQYGVRAGMLIDGAGSSIVPAARVSPPGPAGIADALAATALAQAVGVTAAQAGAALTQFRVGAHRAEPVATVRGVTYIDDSKATNPHAAQNSIEAHERVVWVAGGQLKGADIDPLVARVASRLAGAVLLGVDAELIAAAMARHAPDVPVVRVTSGDDSRVSPVTNDASRSIGTSVAGDVRVSGDADAVMTAAVHAAAGLADVAGQSRTPVVLLAPAAASLDMFRSYGHRGEAFATAARALGAAS